MQCAATPTPGRVLLLHGLLVPGLMALCGLWLHLSGWDQRISDMWFDPALGAFPAQSWRWLEQVGHKGLKSAALLVWLVVLVAALWAPRSDRLRAHRRTLWLTALAMALGPTLTVVLKELNSMACPWSLVQYGGTVAPRLAWFVPKAEVGHCFPGGHAAGGFSLVALFLGALRAGQVDWARRWLWITLVAGTLFSLVRVVQGAHFVSHNLWAAAVDWWAAVAVFAPGLLRGGWLPAASSLASGVQVGEPPAGGASSSQESV